MPVYQRLNVVGVPSRYVNWVRECITTPMYSVAVNGGSAGYLTYFQGDKGIHCPLFFFFFCASNGVPNSDAKKKKGIFGCKDFKFHPRCENMQHINLYSTRMILTRADLLPVQLVKSVWKIL